MVVLQFTIEFFHGAWLLWLRFLTTFLEILFERLSATLVLFRIAFLSKRFQVDDFLAGSSLRSLCRFNIIQNSVLFEAALWSERSKLVLELIVLIPALLIFVAISPSISFLLFLLVWAIWAISSLWLFVSRSWVAVLSVSSRSLLKVLCHNEFSI